MDIEIGSEKEGNYEGKERIIYELFTKDLPITTENFRALCTGEKGGNLHYKNNIFHKVFISYMALGGDITKQDGTGTTSIYGDTFEDENIWFPHCNQGLITTDLLAHQVGGQTVSRPDTNSSNFNILFNT
jgi:cyclophilin family peptidyl-prolyl cis-trans isomerase